MTRVPLVLLAALACVLAAPAPARGQFATPNRAFHAGSAFPLEGRHVRVPCESCHLSGVYRGTPTTCFDCHWVRRQDDKFRTRLGTRCEECHRPTAWSAVRWDHRSMTGTPLNGAHTTIGCESCHKDGSFGPAVLNCVSCHQKDYQASQNPNHTAAGFPTACEACHRPADATFQQTRFDHAASYPLVGTHAVQTCTACHRSGAYKGTPQDCYSCHRAQYDRTRNPAHGAAGFPTTCDQCHKATDPAFEGATFNHNAAFQLVGVHATQACAACHTNNVYKGTARDCVGCHQATYNQTQSPSHPQAGFPTTCEQCHRPTDSSWRGAGFNHNTAFQLVGVHATQACAACHKNNVYKGTARDCVGCHQAAYNQTQSPSHPQAGFPTTCEQCHKPTDSSWRGAGFNHNATFQLVGVHATQGCAACHKNGVYKGTRRDCVGCHQGIYNQTQSPNHAQAGFPTTCEQCHKPTDSSWRGAGFNHNATFQLVGVHATQACAACHKNGVYKGTRRDCVGCHQGTYNQTQSPNHAQAGFPTTCEQCHKPTDSSWRGAGFNHNATFQLVGVHATQACAACHKNNVYKGTARDCVGCHQATYNQTQSPSHAQAGFPTTCEQCHKPTDSSWRGAGFNHNATFQLVGVHATQACAACHKNNVYKGTARDCVGCHQATYNQTQSPSHAQAGFPTTCEQCHKPTDSSWRGAAFNHNATFPLVGVHATRPCSACHQNGVYRGTPRACVSCHQSRYDQTTNPNHRAAGFPTSCEVCHRPSDASWTQGTFSHTWFRLSGDHNRTCSSCHTTPNNFQVFSCVVCHDRTSIDNEHRGRTGYRYDSVACYSCHQR